MGRLEVDYYLNHLSREEILKINVDDLCTLLEQAFILNKKVIELMEFMDDQDKSEMLSSLFKHTSECLSRK